MVALAAGKIKQTENDPSAGFTEAIYSGVGYGTLAVIGGSLMIGSIPLFIQSKKNARTAASISLTSQRLLIPLPQGSISNLQSLTFTISL